jgi:hypothetical protein
METQNGADDDYFILYGASSDFVSISRSYS